MVTVKATGGGEIVGITIDPKAIDPDDPEMLADLVLAAVNEALRSASALMESKMQGMLPGGLGGLGLPGLRPAASTEARPHDNTRRRHRRDRGRNDVLRRRPGRAGGGPVLDEAFGLAHRGTASRTSPTRGSDSRAARRA